MAGISLAPAHNPRATLVVDTATMTTVVGLTDTRWGFAGARALASPPSSSQVLATCVTDLAAEWGHPLCELTDLVVGLGPGSFTGLRVGLAFMNGLARATGLPLRGVSTLAALACSYDGPCALVCAVMDARKGEVYGALYRREAAGLRPTELFPERALTAARLLEQVAQVAPGASIAFVGPGAAALGLLARECALKPFAAPSAAALEFLAREPLAPLPTLGELAPTYLRASDAEIARTARDTNARRNT